MGLFWDLIQQSQISQQQATASSLEQRVAELERALRETQDIQERLLTLLEEQTGNCFHPSFDSRHHYPILHRNFFPHYHNS